MRLFIAFELPADIRNAVGAIQAKLKKTGAKVSWVRGEGMHLTLKFLGETPESRLEEVGGGLKDAAAGIGPVRVNLSGVGCFPDRNSPRVVWVGVNPNDTRLGELHERLEKHLARLGFPGEKRAFRPHLTIGRVRARREGGKLGGAIREMEGSAVGDCTFEAVHLIESRLQPTGAAYRKVRTILLKS